MFSICWVEYFETMAMLCCKFNDKEAYNTPPYLQTLTLSRMNISLKHLILHSLSLGSEGAVELQARPQELAASDKAMELIEELHLGYNAKAAKGFGYYNNENSSQFKGSLDAYLKQETPFLAFSQDIASILVEQVNAYQVVEQGVLLVAEYEHVAGDYLLVAVLERKVSPSVNEQWEITDSHYLETSSIQLAARIDLTDMQRNSESTRYLSYVKGRAGRKISDFFVEFLGCDDGLDVKQQNTVLMQAVEEFCAATQLEAEEGAEVRKEVKSYCEQQLKDGEEIKVKELTEVFPETDEGMDFYQFAADNYPLEEQFPADRGSLKKMAKFFGQGKGVSISFDRDLLGERIQYDPQTDTLTIVGIPPNLREQLSK